MNKGTKVLLCLLISIAFLMPTGMSISKGETPRFPLYIGGYCYYEDPSTVAVGANVTVTNVGTGAHAGEQVYNDTDSDGYYSVNVGTPSPPGPGWSPGDPITVVVNGTGNYTGWTGKASGTVPDMLVNINVILKPPGWGALNESFEGITFPPMGWTENDDSDWSRSTTYSHSGVASARCSWTTDNWLITPKLSVSSGDNISFWGRYSSSASGAFYVKVSDSPDPAGTWTTLQTWSNVYHNWTTTFTEYNVSLDAYAGQDIYVAFNYESSYGCYIYIDDVKGPALFANDDDMGIDSLNEPTGFLYEECNNITINVTVKNFGENTQDNVSVKLKVTNLHNSTVVYEDMKYTGLIGKLQTEDIIFTWYPTTICNHWINVTTLLDGDEDDSNNATSYMVSIYKAGGIGESFTDTTFPPQYWTRIATSTFDWGRSTSTYHTAPAGAYVMWDWDQDEWLITPKVTVVSGDMLKFWYKFYDTGGLQNFTVRISNTTMDQSEFDIVWTADNSTVNWTEVTYLLDTYAGEDIFIAFVYQTPSSGTTKSVYLDDIKGPVVLPIHNAATESINEPTDGGTYSSGDIDINATVKNWGTVTDTFDVNLKIYKLVGGGVILEEGFEEYEGIFPPTGWIVLTNDTTANGNWMAYTSASHVYNGSYSAKGDPQTSTTDAWLITPQLSLSGSPGNLTFWYQSESNSHWVAFHVLVSTGSDQTDYSAYTQVADLNATSTTWAQATIDMSSYANQDVYIALRMYNSDSNYWYMFVDDFALDGWTDGFEGCAPPAWPPSGWRAINQDGDGYNWTAYESSTYAHTGSWLTRCYRNTSGSDDWLITPQISVDPGCKFSFWARSYSSTYLEDINVKLSNNTNDTSDFTETLESIVGLPTTYTYYEYDLSNWSGQNVYLAIQHVSTGGYYHYYPCVDDIMIFVPPTYVLVHEDNESVTLDPDEETDVIFDGTKWMATEGDYAINVTTMLADDVDPTNDYKEITVTILGDTEPPEITDVQATPPVQKEGGYVNITCDVTDNIGVDIVKVNITYPDSSYHNETMLEGSYYYNDTYTQIGTYNFFIWANDTSNNANMSTGYSFEITANHPPNKPTNPDPSNNSIGISTSPTLSVDVSDPDGDAMTVYFYNASDDSLIGTDSLLGNGTASTTWSGLAYNTTYEWYAVANDSALENTSDTWCFNTTAFVLPPCVEIGTGTLCSSTSPVYGLWDYGYTATIYLQSEINYSFDISKIVYDVCNDPANYEFLNQKIYMTHTTLSSWPSATPPDNSTMTLVYEGDITFDGSGWHEIYLDTPFTYDNVDNLVIYWENQDGDYVSGCPTFRYTSHTDRGMRAYGDNVWPPTYGPYLIYYVPNIRLCRALDHDVGVSSINEPGATAPEGNVPINATVCNYGANTETFDVNCSVYTLAGMGTPTYEEDFETSNGGYTSGGTTVLWEWGTPTDPDGPDSAHSGSNCWGTNLAGDYVDSSDATLDSTPLTIPSGQQMLSFWHWYDTEFSYDGGNVKISNDSGVTWTILGSYPNIYNDDAAASGNAGIPYEPCFTGHDQGFWEQVLLDISDYAGETVIIRWHFGSDSSVSGYPGWYIDDVAIGPYQAPTLVFGDDATVTSLGPGNCTDVEFTWTGATPGFYTLNVSTQLADEQPDNDYLEQALEIEPFMDAGVDHFNYPTEGATVNKTITPMEINVTVCNYGNASAINTRATHIPPPDAKNAAQEPEEKLTVSAGLDPGHSSLERGFNVHLEVWSPGGGTQVLSEGFESGTIPPSGWTLNSTNPSYTWEPDTYNPHGGSYYATCYYDPLLVPQDEWLITPTLDFSGYTAPVQLSFWWFMSYYYGVSPYDNYDLNVSISTDGGGNWTWLWNEDGEGVFTDWQWYNEVIDLSAYIGETNVKIGFQYEGVDGAQAGLDDVSIWQGGGPPVLVYSEDVAAPDLGVGNCTEVLFHWPVWTEDEGDYVLTACTQLVGDDNASNDCKTINITLTAPEYRDVGVDHFNEPTDGETVEPGNVTVNATVCNYGTVDETFDVNISIYKKLLNVSASRGDTFYAEDLFANDLVWFDSDIPGVFNTIAPVSSTDFLAGGTWDDDGTWWACEYSAVDNSNIWTIDETDGTMTLVGASGAPLSGIAYDTTTDTMYGIGAPDTSTPISALWTIDMGDGSSTLIGSMTGRFFIGCAFDGAGNLYAIDLGDESLYGIDEGTATASLIGATGLSLNYAQDMAYDIDNDILYLAAYDIYAGGGLYTCDTTTGAATLVGGFPGGAETAGFAIPYISAPPTEELVYTAQISMSLLAGTCDFIEFLWPNATSGQYRINMTTLLPEDINTSNDYKEINVTISGINLPPNKPTNPDPFDGETGIGINPTLSVDVTDPDGDTMDVYFYDASGPTLIGMDTNVSSGGTASITWLGLAYSTTCSWYAVANDSELQNQSDTWSFTTKSAPDTTPPVTTHTLTGTMGSNGWYISNVKVTLTATDDMSGVAYTKYRINGGSWNTYTTSFTLTTEGMHTVNYYSVDNFGNVEPTKSVSFKIDKTAPVTTHSLDPTTPDGDNGWYVSNVEVTLTATDTTSGVMETEYRIDGGSWNTYTAPFTITTDGTYTVEYNSTDNAGNVESTKSVSFKIDKTKPTVNIDRPKGYLYVFDRQIISLPKTIIIGPITIEADTTDTTSGIDKVEFYIDGVLKNTDNVAPYEWKWDETAFLKHTIKVIAYDKAGNAAIPDEIEVTIFNF